MTALPWVKLHTEILGDTKLMRAARKGAKGLELLPWLIAFAGEAGDDGRLTVAGEPAEAVDIASKIPGAKAQTVAQCIASCRKIGVLIDDGAEILRFAAWERRAGKPSDRPESVRERVQRHRAKVRAERVSGENDTPPPSGRNALQPALQVTPGHAIEGEGEKREIKSGEGELSAAGVTAPVPDPAPPAPLPHPADDLPPAAKRFISTFYPRGTAAAKRRTDVAQQLLESLNGGVKLSRGKLVRAVTAQRLAAKCDEVMREGVDKPDAAIVVLLKKLGDVSDLGPDREGPGAQLQRDLKREEQRDARTLGQREAFALEWGKDHPDVVEQIRARLLVEFPGDVVAPTRRMLLVTELEKVMLGAEVPA